MLNWRIRYQRVLGHHPTLFNPDLTVLEVGNAPQGIADLLKRNVTVAGTHGPHTASQWVTPIAASPLSLPFADNAFDHVVCIDSLHHLPPPSRAKAISELARVARRQVILSVPCGALAVEGDQQLAVSMQRMGLKTPPWLQEHVIRALPSVADVLRMLSQTQLRFEVHANEAMMQHYGGLLLDLFYPFSQHISSAEQAKKQQQVLPAGDWEMYYSYLFHLFKEDQGVLLDAGAAPSAGTPTAAAVSKDQDIALYAVYHRRLPLAPGTGITPIYVGEAALEASASERTETTEPLLDNSRWSELSGVHEVWRNGPRSPFVGFCHYRRVFDFSQGGSRLPSASSAPSVPSGKPRSTRLDYGVYLVRASGTATRHAMAHFQDRSDTLIVAPPLDLNGSVWDQYAIAHNINDLCVVTNLIAHRHPYLGPHLAETYGAKTLYANNLFLTRWDHFDELCGLWFDVLGAFERSVPVRPEDRYQRRDVSFLAERVFDAWVRFRQAQGTRLVTVPILEITYPGLDTAAWSRAARPASSANSAPPQGAHP